MIALLLAALCVGVVLLVAVVVALLLAQPRLNPHTSGAAADSGVSSATGTPVQK